MSCFVTRPATPVPCSPFKSTLCSLAIRRTSGDDRVRRVSSSGPASAPLSPEPTNTAGAASVAPGFVAPGADFADAGAGVSTTRSPIVATTLLTATVSPSLTLISASTPSAGDGISASTLSVEISNSGSSRPTFSPTFLIQRTIVPSAIDSPIWGISTGVLIRPAVSCQPPAVSSDVDCRPVCRVRRLAHRLRHRRVRVDGADELFDRALGPEREHGLGHELRRARADDVHAEDLVVFLVG